MGISPLTGKRVNAPYQFSTVKDHMLSCNHVITFGDFSILGNSDKNVILELKESLFIRRDSPVLNKNIASVPLFLHNWYFPRFLYTEPLFLCILFEL